MASGIGEGEKKGERQDGAAKGLRSWTVGLLSANKEDRTQIFVITASADQEQRNLKEIHERKSIWKKGGVGKGRKAGATALRAASKSTMNLQVSGGEGRGIAGAISLTKR